LFKPAEKEQLKVPGHQDYMPDLREFVNRVGRKYGLAEKLINTLKLATDEAATNIIKHGYRDQQSHITIQAFVKRKSITIVLIDQGPFFDPNWAEEPDLLNSAETGERPHLGIFLLRKLIDKIEYSKTDAGNELRLTKHRQPAKKPPRLKPSIVPVQILKSPYSLSFLAVFTILTISFFFYSYKRAEFKRVSDFLSAGEEISTIIANHLGPTRADFLKSADGAIYLKTYLQPIYEEKERQIHSISVTDNSGKIIWSTKSAEIQMPFRRPIGVTFIKEGIFTYAIDGMGIYEFEKLTAAKKHEFFSGKIRVLLFKDDLERQIKIEQIPYLRNGLIVLGVGYIAILFLAYLIKYPLRKIFKHRGKVHDAETDEIADEFDSFISRINENPEWGRLNKKVSKINPPKQSEAKETGTKIDDKAPDKNEGSGVDAVHPAKMTAKKPEYNSGQLPGPSSPAETQKAGKAPKFIKNNFPAKADLEFTLSEFLDCLNSKAETARSAAVNFKKAAQKPHGDPQLESAPEIEELQETAPEPVQEIVEAPDLDFEIGDISDSLVDAIFDDFVGDQIGRDKDDTATAEPQKQEEQEERAEKVVEPANEGAEGQIAEEMVTEESSESKNEEKPEAEIKLLPDPAQKKTPQTEREQIPEADLETESDSILVESIEDLFSKIKKVHNLRSKKDEPAPQPGQTELEPNEKAAAGQLKTEPEISPVSGNEEIEIASEPQVEESAVEFKSEAAELAEKAEDLLVAGVKHYRKKQFEDAIITFRNLLKIEPGSKNIYLLLGNAYFKNGMVTEALSVYEQYKKKYPGESIAHENLALIYEKKGVYQSALKEWQAALDLNHDRPDIKRNIEQAEQAFRSETQNGDSVTESETIESKISRTKVKPRKQDEQKDTILKEGIYHYRNKNFAAAINSFKAANRLFPNFKKAYRFLGITYFRNKMFDESEQTFKKLKQLQFEGESEHENMGIIYAKQGFYRRAVNEWKKVLTVNPHRTDIKEKINKVVELL